MSRRRLRLICSWSTATIVSSSVHLLRVLLVAIELVAASTAMAMIAVGIALVGLLLLCLMIATLGCRVITTCDGGPHLGLEHFGEFG